MSVPTNVTSSTKVMDSGSRRSPASRLSGPAGIQLNRCWSTTRDPESSPSIPTSSTAATTKALPETSTPNQWPQRSLRRPASSSTAAPTSGIATSSQVRVNTPSAGAASAKERARPPATGRVDVTGLSSALQQVDVVDGGRPAGPEDRDDDRQADDDLGGRDDHDEQRHDLTGQVPVHPCEGHEGQVAGV